MSTKITIIGAGPGGYVAAIRAAQSGAKVTVIEKENIGGVCLNRGCIPSKIMITTAEMLEKFHHAEEFGLTFDGDMRPDMARLMARKKAVIDIQAKGILGLFKHHKINYLKGDGRITKHGLAEVRQADGNIAEVAWDKLILATGTRPFNIPAFPFDGDKILSSDHALNLDEIPESIMIVGGGVIGCEFACMLASLGASVTVVEALSRILPLPSVDLDCSKVLAREMKKRKIKLIVNRTVDSVKMENDLLNVTIGPSPFLENPSERDRKPQTATVQKMLVCIGRKPNTAGIGLETIILKPDKKGWIAVNAKMETEVADVYAIGDILGPEKIMLAHVASAEGLTAAENAMGGDHKMDYTVVPGAIFTAPEVANVGLTQAQAKEAGYKIRADKVLFRTIGKAHVIGEIAGQAKIVSDAQSGKILGAHIIGPHATDLIAEVVLAIKMGAGVKDIAETIHAHPTLAEIMQEVSFKGLGQGVHG
ncbi:dihydrolipoyl dehydrogenase [Desulfococcaceae bacterium HSG7]|nr:dihydrolipoyl dehydrogenase [Desulfococcaceae bacterium HSG7]